MYLASAVIVVSSNPCVGHSARTKTFFLLSSICTEKLLFNLKIMTFLPQLQSGNENCVHSWKPIP